MIHYIQGILAAATPTYAIIEAAGVGYKIYITAMTFGKLPQTGAECRLYTVHVVREQSQTLYGFLQTHACDLFETLLGVGGIGPKLAMSILGHMTEVDFSTAISNEDIPLLSKIPGIGKKTAQRLLIEMRDKLPEPDSSFHSIAALTIPGKQAINALVNLGYSQLVAQKAVKKTLEGLDEQNCDLAAVIAESLKNI